MSTSSILQYIRMIASTYRNDPRSDRELLSLFAETHDNSAFASLMGRHGPLVWSVCSRILGDTHDAEDAFQGTFLALSNKAGAIQINETLAGWLHLVARRTARHVLLSTGMQRRLEARLRPQACSSEMDEHTYEMLHDELAKLPEKLRTVLVLHYLERNSQAEVAGILGVKKSTVWNRLAQAKAVLEKRLKQRGVATGALALTTLLEQATAQCILPRGLLSKTVKAATAFRAGKLTGGLASLAQEVLKYSPSTAPWWKTAWMIPIFCLSGLGIGAGGMAFKANFFGVGAKMPVLAADRKTARPDPEKVKQPRLDVYGDPLPPGALARLGTVRLRHCSGGSEPLAFTPDGKRLLTAGPNGPPRLWDVPTGRMLHLYGSLPPSSIEGATLSPDGHFVACRQGRAANGRDDTGSLHIWEAATGKLVRRFAGDGRDPRSLNCAFFPAGNMIAAQLDGSLGVWNAVTGHTLWQQAEDDIRAIAISVDGKIVATTSNKPRGVSLRDANTGRKIGTLADEESVAVVSFSSDRGILIASSGGNGWNFQSWDAKTGKERWKWSEKLNDIFGSPAFSPDGKFMALSVAGKIQLRAAATGKHLQKWQGSEAYGARIVFSPDSRLIASTHGGVVHFWIAESGKEQPLPQIHAHDRSITSAGFLADDETLISGGEDGAVCIWDVRTGQQRQKLANKVTSWRGRDGGWNHASPMTSPDGKLLAANFLTVTNVDTATNPVGIFAALHSDIRFWDAASGKELQHFQKPGVVWKMNFSPDGKLAAVCLWNPMGHGADHIEAFLWDVAAGKENSLRFSAQQVVFSPDNSVMITLDNRRQRAEIHFWEIATGKKIHTIESDKWNRHLAISPDGGTLGIGDGSNTITLLPLSWSRRKPLVTVGPPRQIEGLAEGSSNLFVFSPDSRLLAFRNGNEVYVWEIAPREERARFTGHASEVTTLCFSPDSRRLVSGSRDTSLLVWDLTGRLQDNGRLRGTNHTESQLEDLWKELRNSDAVRASGALWALVADPLCVAFLEKRLNPVETTAAAAETPDQLITQLDSDSFQGRMGAYNALAKLGEQAEDSIRKALQSKRSVQSRRMLQTLLAIADAKRTYPPADVLQNMRTVEVLEHIATKDAVQLLRQCAAAEAGAGLIREARNALTRLEQQLQHQKKQTTVAKSFQP